MEGKFILKAGTRLRSISLKDDISHPTQALYFTTLGEALVCLFRRREKKSELGLLQILEIGDDFYLNTFELTEDLIIESENAENLAKLIDTNYKLEDLRQVIAQNCQNRDGFVFPYKCSVLRKGVGYIDGRITAYVICKPDILVHVGSFYINTDVLYNFIAETIRIWYIDEGVKDITIAAILNEINESLLDVNWINYMFKRVFIQPNVPGYLTSKQFSVENLSQIPLPISPPKSPIPSPVYPESLFEPVEGFDPFSKLPKDLIIIIASNMRLTDISNFCLTSKQFNQLICNNENFWIQKVKLDFKNAKPKPDNLTWKTYYRELAGLVQNELDFAQLMPDVMLAIRNLPPEEQMDAINELRREAGLGEIRADRDENEIFNIYNPVLMMLNRVVDEHEYNETTRAFFFDLQEYGDRHHLPVEEAFDRTFNILRRLFNDDNRMPQITEIFDTEWNFDETYQILVGMDEFIDLFREAEINPHFRPQLFRTILDISEQNNREPLWIFDEIPVPNNEELRNDFILFLEIRGDID